MPDGLVISDALVRAYPRAMNRTQIGKASNLSPNSGTFGSYMAHLKALGIVEVYDGALRIADTDWFPRSTAVAAAT